MKRTSILLLILILCIALCACNNETTGNLETTNTMQSTEQGTQESTTNPTVLPTDPTNMDESEEVEVLKAQDFVDGRAWIQYKQNDEIYWGIIDKEGNVLSRMKSHSNLLVNQFSNGYSYVHDTNQSYIFDVDGNVTYQYEAIYAGSTDSGIALVEEGGLVVNCLNVSDFYGEGYQYTIYGHDGTILEQFVSERELDVESRKKGVVCFWDYGYYCSQTDTWALNESTDEYIFINDYSFSDVGDEDAIPVAYGIYNSNKIVYLYPDGTKYVIDWSSLGDINHGYQITPIINDVCIVGYGGDFRHENYSLALFNVATKERYLLDKTYVVKYFEFVDDRISIVMDGEDENPYVFAFDMQLNVVYGPVSEFDFEPVVPDVITYTPTSSDKRIIQNGTPYNVYDLDGNFIFNIIDAGYDYFSPIGWERHYSDGVMIVWDAEHKPVYIGIDGNRLYEKLNFDNTTVIELEGTTE